VTGWLLVTRFILVRSRPKKAFLEGASGVFNGDHDKRYCWQPAWSPDGAKIVFISTRHGYLEIYAMNAGGSNETRLANHDQSDWTPSWSPDGTKIAFESYRDGNNDIYIMNRDGSNLTRLTNNSGIDQMPAWGP